MRTIVAAVTTAFALTFTAFALPHWSEAVGDAPQQSPAAKPAAKSSFTPDQLDKLMAPVALYPDSLLAQMLMSATNPAKVGALAEWMASQSAKGTALQEAATKSGFDASFAALVLFPDVVNYMAGNMDWTTKVGKAFTENRSAVFDSIQRLRAQAKKMGTLKTTPQQEVETKTTSSGSEVIVIEPTNPQVVYVPQYNPTVVYTQPATQTVVIKEDDDSSEAVAAGLIGFTAGIAMGAAMDNNYYYGPYGWHGGGYMYNDAWDDYYDARDDARDDWQDHREDMYEERGDIAKERGEQRTERTETRNENRPEATQAQRDQAKANAQNRSASGTQATTQSRTANQESRGYSRSGDSATTQRSGTKSDAFSGYSSGKSERAASQRGQKSRGSSRSGGSRRR
ncbi:MAG TPA: DUF3300 domain-containing protein [Vicinamibacterales bacterium]|jgi:uncharacterized protein DUF3300|nr:DUF3300 domain-containing protein [Vicinamibacterales bacterium]